MNIQLSWYVGNFWLLEKLLARQKGLCCVGLGILYITLGKDHVFSSFKSVAAFWMHSDKTDCQKSLWKYLGLTEALNRSWGWVTKGHKSQHSPRTISAQSRPSRNTVQAQSQRSCNTIPAQLQHSPSAVPTHSQHSPYRRSVIRKYSRCCGPALTIRVAITTAGSLNCNPQCDRHTHIT